MFNFLQMLSWSDCASIATTVGVFIVAYQLWLTKRQAITAFEDSLVKEYRELSKDLSTKALLGETLTKEEYAASFDAMYHYFDLCNQQAFLRQEKRISEKTWKFWLDGIESNLRRPAFSRAWAEIAARANGDFSELRELVKPGPYTSQSNENI